MKRRVISRKIQTLLLAVFCSFSIAGCTQQIGPLHFQFSWAKDNNELVRVNNEVMTEQEAKILLLTESSRYRELYGDGILAMELDGGTLSDQVKNETKNLIGKIMVLNAASDKYQISLTDEEKEASDAKADSFYLTLDDDEKAYIGLTDGEETSTLRNLYSKITLADKVFTELSGEKEMEISDDEARVVVFRHIMLKTVKEDESGREVEMSDTEKTDVYSRILEIYDKITAGASFDAMAEQYNEDSRTEYSVGRGEINETLEDVIFSMQTGDMSPVVESKEGYHIILCMNNYDKEATQNNKTKILQTRRWEEFEDTYNKMAEECEVEFQDKIWDNISLPDEGVNNSSLIDIYKQD